MTKVFTATFVEMLCQVTSAKNTVIEEQQEWKPAINFRSCSLCEVFGEKQTANGQ